MNPKEFAQSFSRAQAGFVVLTAAFSALGGAAVGAKVAIAKLEDKLREEADLQLQEKIAEAKVFYKKDSFKTAEEALQILHPGAAGAQKGELELAADAALVAYAAQDVARAQNEFSNNPPPTGRGDLIEISKNVFTDAKIPGEFDPETEIRDPDKPYVISKDEFEQAEFDYDQVQFTYYSGDGVLANEMDEEVPNIEKSVGSDNLLRFGQGSGDPHIVYVRNASANMDFSVVLSEGKFAFEVLGLGLDDMDDDETNSLQHDFSSRLKKFKHRDDKDD